MKRIMTITVVGAFLVTSMGPVGAGTFIYPKEGQSPEQQQQDQYECHVWAVDQTGVDPTNPGQPAPATAQSGGGEVARTAAKGAALGAIGGAIAGDAGKGAAIGAAVGAGGGALKRRRGRQQQAQAQQQEAQQQQAEMQTYQRAVGACLQGRGYQVG